ncbi:MAG: ABC transporter substrate-binding protein [Bdellovibrionota bacterium]
MKILLSAVVLFSLFNSQAYAQKRPQGGDFTTAITSEPITLNPINYSDASASTVLGYIVEGLLGKNVDTYDWEPNLAEKWEISKDKKTFTFTLRDNLKWSDGKPLTVEDVKFSFQTMKDPKYKAMSKMPYYEGLSSCDIVDAKTVKFTASTNYFLNFDVAAELAIVPKHIYEDPKAKINKTVTGSGPYMIDTYEKGRRIALKRNPNWWGWEKANKDGEYNFDRIVFRFIDSPNIQLEMLKKGDIDYMGLEPEQFVKKTDGPEWGKTLIKVKTKNDGPKGYNWVGLNLQNKILADQKVRLALAHLMNRDMMIEKFRYGLAEKTSAPGLLSEFKSSSLKPILFDPKKALEVLRSAGWEDTDKNGILDKVIDGKKTNLKIEILLPTEQWTRYLTVFKEDAKKVGVDIGLKNVEWNTFSKLLDEKKFDAVTMAWAGGGIEWDPKQIWHSTSNKGGSNFINYNNPEVDKLIDDARTTWDRSKRAEKLKKLNDLIAADVPYIFLFNPSNVVYAHRSSLEKVKDTYKFGVGTSFWWKKK